MAITRTVDYADWHYDQEDFVLEDFSNGITGTTDPKFDIRSNGLDAYFTYEGAFKVPYIINDGETDTLYSTRGSTSFCYDQVTNTIFMGKMTTDDAVVGQFSIPALSTSEDIGDLQDATQLQDFFEFKSLLTYDDTTDSKESRYMNAMWKEGLDLYIGTYNDYDTTGVNTDNLVICRGASDFATATWQGYIDMGQGDKTAGYIAQIPAEHQSDFGNNTHFMGCGNPPSIAGRWDFGHSFYATTLSSIGTSDTTGTVTEYMAHGVASAVDGWTTDNDDIVAHYLSYFSPSGAEINDYLNRPVDEKMTYEQCQLLPRADVSQYNNCGGWEVYARDAFIAPNSDSMVLIGSVDGLEMGRSYTGYPLEEYSEAANSSSPEPISNKDWRNVIWCVNLDDIKNATEVSDPNYCYFGDFYNRWKEWDDYLVRGTVAGASFDQVNGKLYVLYENLYYTSTQTQHIVEVYSVTGTGA